MHFGSLSAPCQTPAMRGEAELHILDFKTTRSEFQKFSQTAATRFEAELHILDFKTTWSEFQKSSQTAAMRVKAELRILDFKTTQSEFQTPVFHPVPSVGPKQLCALAHLGNTCAAGTSLSVIT